MNGLQSDSRQHSLTRPLRCTGQLLEPDDVTFAVMVRGYGESDPPQWTAISALLSVMQSRYDMKPSTGAAALPAQQQRHVPRM